MRQSNIFTNVETEDDSMMLIGQNSVVNLQEDEDEDMSDELMQQRNNIVEEHFTNTIHSLDYRIEDINELEEEDLFKIVIKLYNHWQLDYNDCVIDFTGSINMKHTVDNMGTLFFQKFSEIFHLDWNQFTNVNQVTLPDNSNITNESVRINNQTVYNVIEDISYSDRTRNTATNNSPENEQTQILSQMENKINALRMIQQLDLNFNSRMQQVKSMRNEMEFNRFRTIKISKEQDDVNNRLYASINAKQNQMLKIMDDIQMILYFGYNRIKSDILLICYNDGFGVSERIRDQEAIKKLECDEKSIKDQQRILLRAVHYMETKGFGKKNPKQLCKPRYTNVQYESKDGTLYNKKCLTHCWDDLSGKECIENILQEWTSIDEADISKWKDMFSNVNTMKNVVNMLFDQRTYRFPTIESVMTLYSFRNGLLCIDADCPKTVKYFGSYEEMSKIDGVFCNIIETEVFIVSLPSNHPKYKETHDENEKVKEPSIKYWFAPYETLDYVSKKNKNLMDRISSNVYIDEVFNPQTIHMSINEEDENFFENHIHCDKLQQVFDLQKFSNTLVRDFYALVFGRMLQPYHKHDRAHITPAMLGAGGGGKSIVLSALKSFFQLSSIALLSAGQQKEFGMEKLIGKHIWVYDEMEKDSNVGFDVFKQLSSGETISINRKNLASVDEKDKKAGIFCGNQLANNFDDAQGQASRRIAVFLFTETAGKKEDETLEAKILAQRSSIIMRGFYSYFHLVNRINSRKMKRMWSVLDKELIHQQQMIQTRKNTILRFLKDSDSMILIDENRSTSNCVSYDEFMDKYDFYCKVRRIQRSIVMKDYNDVLIALKMVSIPIVNMMSSKGLTNFIIGVKRNNESKYIESFVMKNHADSFYPTPIEYDQSQHHQIIEQTQNEIEIDDYDDYNEENDTFVIDNQMVLNTPNN